MPRGSVWQGSAESPAQAANGSRSVVVALPARSCRTFAFSAPTEDRQLMRQLAFAQVEKRGLATGDAAATAFDCHVIEQDRGRSLVSVDVLASDAATTIASSSARALIASARLFQLPEDKLVILQEQGRLVLCAGCDGRLVHSQILAPAVGLNGHTAADLRMAALSLQQGGVLSEIEGVELWGDFSREDAAHLGEQLGWPVELCARPAPESSAVQREASTQLLPPAARAAAQRRKLKALRWVAVAVLALPIVFWLFSEKRKLAALESEAARIEATLNVPSNAAKGADQERNRADHELVTAAQARWSALRMALEPRRYPVATLDALSRCLAAADVVLTRFESKLVDASVGGTARSAMDAYNYLNAVNKESTLGVYAWTMLPPTIAADGSVSFEIKGKMR